MKVVFVGPSLHGASIDWSGLEPRPPAAQGDVFAAVKQGATAIGLIDGYFGSTASVWHKEILFGRSVHRCRAKEPSIHSFRRCAER